jgi:hypothetical protein
MKRQTKTLQLFTTFAAVGTAIIGLEVSAQSIPTEYYPNYAIQDDWNKIQEYFVQIEAAQKI